METEWTTNLKNEGRTDKYNPRNQNLNNLKNFRKNKGIKGRTNIKNRMEKIIG